MGELTSERFPTTTSSDLSARMREEKREKRREKREEGEEKKKQKKRINSFIIETTMAIEYFKDGMMDVVFSSMMNVEL